MNTTPTWTRPIKIDGATIIRLVRPTTIETHNGPQTVLIFLGDVATKGDGVTYTVAADPIGRPTVELRYGKADTVAEAMFNVERHKVPQYTKR